jgi:acyl-CoA synthetase (AMP-forming)/AMP-acid ligase II
MSTLLNSSAANRQAPSTMSQVLRLRATTQAQDTAFTFLADGDKDAHSITWAQLDERAAGLGMMLRNAGAAGQPILLALPSGLDFIQSLFACWYAGAIAVPVSLPRHHRAKHRLDRIISHASAKFAIATDDTRQRLCGDHLIENAALKWIAPSEVVSNPQSPSPAMGESWRGGYPQGMSLSRNPHPNPPPEYRGKEMESNRASLMSGNAPDAGDAPAVLQYTSGSTGEPRGVVVTHANLLNNSAQIAQACGHAPGMNIGGWLPLFHDMGLVGMIIQTVFNGARCIFMPPERFLMRPWLWLRMISDYRAHSSPAPNFAYDLCVDRISDEQKAGLDLSCWRNALNGSEPVRARTLDRFADAFACCGFSRESFFPCYGLAEATLFVTGPSEKRGLVRRSADGTLLDSGATGGHIACGSTFGDTRLRIVDPQTRRPLPDGAVGEIWIASASCAAGYWNDPQATEATYHGNLDGSPTATDVRWLRTGDLGFIADGQLFITGRLRELIKIAGRNHFPVDLERTVEAAEPNVIAPSAVAAFSAEIDGHERLIIAAEVRREHGKAARADVPPAFTVEQVVGRVRAAVAAEHDVSAYEIILLQTGALLRTTSGKISRAAVKQAYLNQSLERFEEPSHVHVNA